MKTDVENEGQRAIKRDMPNVIEGADLSGAAAQSGIFFRTSQTSKSAQEDALRRYALIERVLRCPPSMLSALENTLGMGK